MSETTDQQQWLDQVVEDIVEPDLPICDPHHHLWDHPGNRYLLDELMADIGSGHNVVSTVFVECMAMYRAEGDPNLAMVGETEFVNGVAAMAASGLYGSARPCSGIVSRADLSLGAAVGDVLDAHMAVSDRFKGIRHAVSWDASDAVRNAHTRPTSQLLLDETFRRGFAELVKRNLSFEAWLYHPQIPELTSLARTFPDANIILNHFGGPVGIGPYAGQQAEIFAQWQADVTELATCPNVVAKLGGLVMPLNGFGFHKLDKPPTSDELVAATQDYYHHMIDCMGVDRCMFESNFPVDKASCSYAVLFNSFKKLVADASASEKAALFHDTATRVYRL